MVRGKDACLISLSKNSMECGGRVGKLRQKGMLMFLLGGRGQNDMVGSLFEHLIDCI